MALVLDSGCWVLGAESDVNVVRVNEHRWMVNKFKVWKGIKSGKRRIEREGKNSNHQIIKVHLVGVIVERLVWGGWASMKST